MASSTAASKFSAGVAPPFKVLCLKQKQTDDYPGWNPEQNIKS